MTAVIKVENLSKKYVIRHEGGSGYGTLRDSLKSFGKQFISLPGMLVGKGWKSEFKRTEEFWALDDVSFEVNEGERIGIIGRNGAGKSTLLKIFSRITEPTKGRISLKGRVASLLEVGTGFHPELSGRENIFLNGAMLGMTKKEISRKFEEIVDFAEVEKFLDTPVKRYSSGMYVRLAFSVAAHLDPEILIVDEVLAVGDMRFRNKCLGKMQDVGASGRTILFVSHDMSVIRQLCDRAILLEKGRIAQSGSSDSVTEYYEKMSLGGFGELTGTAVRDIKPSSYHIVRAEIRDPESGCLVSEVKAGDSVELHLWTNQDAPQDDFTVEFNLTNERGARISFGAANPVRDVFFKKEQRHFVCKLGPLPLTSGKYMLHFSVRVWGMERWDYWENAIPFHVTRCDLFGTHFDVPNGPGGDFVLLQEWRGE